MTLSSIHPHNERKQFVSFKDFGKFLFEKAVKNSNVFIT